VGEHAAGVPCRKRSDQPRRTVEPDAGVADGLGPGQLAAWTREFLHALQPHRAGVYVNFLDADDDTARVHEAYGDNTYRRLAEIKARYDPDNVFHNNKNIEPRDPAT
jgi:hypothetical protein